MLVAEEEENMPMLAKYEGPCSETRANREETLAEPYTFKEEGTWHGPFGPPPLYLVRASGAGRHVTLECNLSRG